MVDGAYRMREPSFEDALKVLLLQAADEGRGEALFGESLARAASEAPPFVVGEQFPDVYLECPLSGSPFLDVTVLYSRLEPGTRVDHPAAVGTKAMLDWFAETCRDLPGVCCGFELDAKEPELPAAAVHFQPREHADLVRPFCESVGEPERADLYLELAERMPEGWSPSFFGMFRGRPGSPLRVCGYLDDAERKACAEDPCHLAQRFDSIGFPTYKSAMLEQVSALMDKAPVAVDYQFDVFSDGRLGPTFAIDVQFGIEQPETVLETFEGGAGADIMRLLEGWSAADDRWKVAVRSAFACAIPVELADGGVDMFAFALMPRWVKARWTDGTLQPAKLYQLAHAGVFEAA